MKRFTLHNPHDEIRHFRRRIIVVGIIIAVLITLLIARLVYLQIVQHRYYLTLSKHNLLSVGPIDPSRGLVYDRNGVLLAGNMPVFSLEVYPDKVPNLRQAITNIEKIINLSPSDIQDYQKQLYQNRRFNSVPLKVKLTDQEIAAFAVNQYQFPGFTIKAHMVRYYPFGAAMTPVLGYVGRINANELAKVDPTNYSATNYIGKTGIEKYYEPMLHGTVGIEQIETSAQGDVVRSNLSRPAIAGHNLYLTIDSRLQLAILKVLQNQPPAAVVALDPRNGELLALVSNPSFDPNQFVTGITTQAYQDLQNDPQRPLFNRALQGEFPPGSTIKPFFAIAGLSKGLVTLNTYIFDPGYFTLPNSKHVYHDWQRAGHGSVNVEKAIIESCDTFFFHLAQLMGIDGLDDILQTFHFGQTTQLDTSGELAGLIPTPAWKERVHHQAWYPGDTVITGIGQGYLLVTPLQLANALMRVVDRGQGFQSHILLKDETPDGIVTTNIPKALSPIELPAAVWNIVLRALQEVISSPYGTGYQAARGATYTFAGKSGTAQVFSLKGAQQDKASLLPLKLRDHSWFIAFAPTDHPTVVLAVFVEHGGEGDAVIVARKILDSYFALNKAGSSQIAGVLHK